jgi:tRNA threonylcarbamoyladenosine modification (KEOPS) complex  Pcc1 subunit
MKAKAVLRLKFCSREQLDVVLRALEPEIKRPISMRSRAMLEKDGELLVLNVEAKDTVALRAALNAYLRWINSILGVLEVLKKQ